RGPELSQLLFHDGALPLLELNLAGQLIIARVRRSELLLPLFPLGCRYSLAPSLFEQMVEMLDSKGQPRTSQDHERQGRRQRSFEDLARKKPKSQECRPAP